MKCGICKSDQMAMYGSGDQRHVVLGMAPIRNVSDLNSHKRRAHSDELQANRDKKRVVEKEKKRLETEALDRRDAAKKALGKPVLMSNNYEGLHIAYTHKISVRDITEGYATSWGGREIKVARYPEPEIHQMAIDIKAEADRLKVEAEEMLARAWEAGTSVTQQDLFEIQQAGERAYHGEGV